MTAGAERNRREKSAGLRGRISVDSGSQLGLPKARFLSNRMNATAAAAEVSERRAAAPAGTDRIPHAPVLALIISLFPGPIRNFPPFDGALKAAPRGESGNDREDWDVPAERDHAPDSDGRAGFPAEKKKTPEAEMPPVLR